MAFTERFTSVRSVVASVGFVDLVTGTSEQLLYLGQANGTGILSFNKFYGEPIGTEITMSSDPNDTIKSDVDYDIAVKRTFILDGKATGSASYGVETASGDDYTAYWKMLLIHYDGSTETTIATLTSKSLVTASNEVGEQLSAVATVTRTIFKPGDTLRVSFQAIAGNGGGSTTGGKLTWTHDPQGRNFAGNNNTKVEGLSIRINEILIPFEVNV